MTDWKIVFTESGFSLPDGTCLGVQGEHNAVQLVISLPQSMVDGMDYHTITIGGVETARIVSEGPNVDGAYRDGCTICQPLTAYYTKKRCVDLSVTAYRQIGSVVQVIDKTPTVYGLRFDAGQPVEGIGGLPAEVAQLHSEVDALRDDLPSSEDVSSWDGAAEAAHKHENPDTLARFSGTEDSVSYNGGAIPLLRPDNVTCLAFSTYDSLLLRDDAVTGESIQDVPVYVQGGAGNICGLYADAQNPDTCDSIILAELRQADTGMPLRILKVRMNGVYAAYYPAAFDGGLSGTVQAGWNSENTPCAAPAIADFTPAAFKVGADWYSSLAALPDKARSALRSLSQCVNVSDDAMGTLSVPDDAVLRFAGSFEPGRTYAFLTDSDCAFSLPAVSWTQTDTQFVLYLTCTADVDVTFPQTVRFAGGAPNTQTGAHKLFGSYLRGVGAWSVGGVDYEEAT